jgi:hypothetical protein
VFEHFAANLAFWGALILVFRQDSRWIGAALAVIFAVASVGWGLRTNTVAFVLYAYVYGIIAVDVLVCSYIHDGVVAAMYLLFSSVAAIAGLFATYNRFRSRA